MFDVGVATQALEARVTQVHEALRPSLLAGLLRRRRWLAGTVIAASGWPLHLAALPPPPPPRGPPPPPGGVVLLLGLRGPVVRPRGGARAGVPVLPLLSPGAGGGP